MRWLIFIDSILQLLTLSRIIRLLILAFLALAILLPLLSGHSALPQSLDPRAIGTFLKSIFDYWAGVLQTLMGREGKARADEGSMRYYPLCEGCVERMGISEQGQLASDPVYCWVC